MVVLWRKQDGGVWTINRVNRRRKSQARSIYAQRNRTRTKRRKLDISELSKFDSTHVLRCGELEYLHIEGESFGANVC